MRQHLRSTKSISQNQIQKDFKRICKGLLQNTASIFLHPLSAQLLVTSVRSARTEVRSARTDVSKRQNNWIAEIDVAFYSSPSYTFSHKSSR